MPPLPQMVQAMKLCLSGIDSRIGHIPFSVLEQSQYVLESFFYVDEKYMSYYLSRDIFILDSGAFTFLNSAKTSVNWDAYVAKYVDFINRYDIRFFFEMDIDKIVGLPKVEQYRSFIERETGKRCIPVWHKSRGLAYWHYLCRNYDYVAIGGIAIKDIPQKDHKYFREFTRIAKQWGAKVHGLGCTSADCEKHGFFSVDSSSWGAGGRFGQLHMFNGKRIEIIRPSGKRAKDYLQLDRHNFIEWCAYQRYLDKL